MIGQVPDLDRYSPPHRAGRLSHESLRRHPSKYPVRAINRPATLQPPAKKKPFISGGYTGHDTHKALGWVVRIRVAPPCGRE
jgi:hypothetical protein